MFLRTVRTAGIFAIGIVALATSALAQTPAQYSQVRHDHPGIDDAVAAMPNSDFNSTYNRLSELFRRKQIASLTTGAATRGELPENFLRNLEATLIDARADLKEDELASLTDQQVLYVLQVVNSYAIRRTVDLYSPNDFTSCSVISGCIPTPEHPCPICIDDDPIVFDRIDGIITTVRGVYARVRADAGNPADTPSAGQLNGNNFGGAVSSLSLVLGVESIDD